MSEIKIPNKSLGELLDDACAGEAVRILCLDTETTGVTEEDRVIQFSAVMLTLRGVDSVRSSMATSQHLPASVTMPSAIRATRWLPGRDRKSVV